MVEGFRTAEKAEGARAAAQAPGAGVRKRLRSCVPVQRGKRPVPALFRRAEALGYLWAAKGTKNSRRCGFLCTFSQESTQRGAHAPASGSVLAGSLNDHERLRFSHDRSGRSPARTLSFPRRAKCAGRRPLFPDLGSRLVSFAATAACADAACGATARAAASGGPAGRRLRPARPKGRSINN